jgi:glycosyltransferase 2 family protein
MGPLLFLVMLIPFTINGLGVREAFFIAFLGRFGVDADAAFATGFLFYAVTVAASIPGGAIMIWDSLRPALMRPREG